MKNIYVYTGTGAYQAKDIENFLAVFDYDYERLTEGDLGKLDSSSILIVPGGEIKAYLPAWGKVGVEIIKKFVQSGGTYIGICAGVYVAGESFADVPGLDFFSTTLNHQNHQETINVKDKMGNTWQLISENGPDLSAILADEIILRDENDKPQAVKINLGNGRVYLFASHPEGSIYYKKFPHEFSGARFFDQFLKQISENIL